MKINELPMPQRERAGIPILGLDISTPDDIVEDGKCEELHNLRYTDNAWRPMHPHKLLHAISTPLPTKAEILYHHPASNRYIVRSIGIGGSVYSAYDFSVADGDPITLVSTAPDNLQVSHFGSILTLSSTAFFASFLWQNGAYQRTEVNKYTPRVDFGITYAKDTFHLPDAILVDTVISFSHDNKTVALNPNQWYACTEELLNYIIGVDQEVKIRQMWIIKDPNHTDGELRVPSTIKDEHWSGEHAFFTALRMKDGSVCNPSPVLVNISQNYYGDLQYSVIEEGFNVYDPLLGGVSFHAKSPLVLITPSFSATPLTALNNMYNPMRYGKGHYEVSIEEDVDANMIDSVVIYSTRVYPTLSLHKIEYKDGGTMEDAYNEVELPNEPFYILEEKRLTEMEKRDGRLFFSVEFDAQKAEDIVNNTLYIPSIPNEITGAVALDYNNRLHLANITTRFSPSRLLNESIEPSSGVSTSLGVLIEHNFHKIPLWGEVQPGAELYLGYNLIMSYHDYRVRKFLVYVTDSQSSRSRAFVAKPATGNNIAYMVMTPTPAYKYPSIPLLGGQESDYTPHTGDVTLTDSNRIQVSQANNPFAFPFNLSYAVGSANNRIIALQSAALQLIDEKIGDHPLIAFTEEGVFGLRAGNDTLYARVDAINHDKIINPNTLAVNNMIVYVTENGIKLLSGESHAIISAPIHDANGVPPIDFLRACKMTWIKNYNEILFHTPELRMAYVYNLDKGFWSTRDFAGNTISPDELVNGSHVYDLTQEDRKATLDGSITTRPVKLNSLGFKRLETIIPRLSPNAEDWALRIRGALSPALDWKDIRSVRATTKPAIIRRTPFSAKYFQFALTAYDMQDSFAITNIDVEYYHRFRHRLR